MGLLHRGPYRYFSPFYYIGPPHGRYPQGVFFSMGANPPRGHRCGKRLQFRMLTSFSDLELEPIGLLKSDSAWNWSRFGGGGTDPWRGRDRIKTLITSPRTVNTGPRREPVFTVIKCSTKLKSATASVPPQPSRIPGAFHQHRPILTDGDQTFKAERC